MASPDRRFAGARVGFSASLSNVIGAAAHLAADGRRERLAFEHASDRDRRLLADAVRGARDDDREALDATHRRAGVVEVDLHELHVQLRTLLERRRRGEVARRPSASSSKWSACACPSAGTR